MNKNIVLIRNAQPYDFGGGERFPVFIAEVLKNKGFSPVVISHSSSLRKFANENNIHTIKGWWWSYQNWSGFRVLFFPVYVLWQIVLTVYYLILFLHLNPSAVHIQSKDDFISGSIAAKLLGRRVIWTDHADLKHVWLNLQKPLKNPVGKLVYTCALFVDAISVVSNSEKVLILNNIKKNSRIISKLHIIYNGAFDGFSHKKNTDDDFIYICVSRLVTDKGISELIRAFIQIQNTHTNIKLWLIGDGRERNKFENLANNNDSIVFHGQQSNPLTYLSKSDVFVHPTHHEGFSLALVEASMMELPIIATDVGGNPEIISHRKTGVLVQAKNVKELASAMSEMYKNKALRTSVSKEARKQYTERFNFSDIVVDQFIPLYKGVVK